jgi:hypothetical protein
MSNLSNVVPDIYKHLDSLSNGTALPLTDEDIDFTTESIREVLKSWATPRAKDAKFHLRMSNVGKAARQLYYESKKDSSEPSSINAPTQIKFLYGHLLEEIVLMLVRMAGHKVTDEQKEIDVEGIKGHMDCKINGEVVDVKTASRFAFQKFQNGRLPYDDPFGYLAQLSGYEEAENTSNGGFLVMNKESGELCMYTPELEDKVDIVAKINSLIPALALDTEPERCYDPVPDGVKGNMKLPKDCNWCEFKFQCHADANDGEGLRTFKYSNGLSYLTKVVNTPKVDELL